MFQQKRGKNIIKRKEKNEKKTRNAFECQGIMKISQEIFTAKKKNKKKIECETFLKDF